MYTYVLVQQSGSVNSIVATSSGVCAVDKPELHVHDLVATCHAKSPGVLPVQVPQLLRLVQL